MNVHDFVADPSDEKYQRTIFCRKCGQVSWNYDRDAEWNKANLQNSIKECKQKETK